MIMKQVEDPHHEGGKAVTSDIVTSLQYIKHCMFQILIILINVQPYITSYLSMIKEVNLLGRESH